MALPNLAGLSLHAAAPTGRFVRYYAADYAALDAGVRKEKARCPISFDDFTEGQLVWQATRQEGGNGLNYDPEAYFEWLSCNRKDPCTRIKIRPEVVRRLEDGIKKEAVFKEDWRKAANGIAPPAGYSGEQAAILQRAFEQWEQHHPVARMRRLERERLEREREQMLERLREEKEQRRLVGDARLLRERALRDEWRRRQGWIDGAPPSVPGRDSDIDEEDLFGE